MGYDQPRNPEGIVSPTQTQTAIKDVFQNAEPCEPFDAAQIAQKADIARETARKQLQKMHDAGVITRKESPASRWVAYHLTPEQDDRVEVKR